MFWLLISRWRQPVCFLAPRCSWRGSKRAMPASWPLSTSNHQRKKGWTTNTKKTQKKVGGPLKTPILLALIKLCDKEARTTNDHQWHHQMITLNLTIYALWLLTKCDKVSLFHLASMFNKFHTHQVYYSSIRSSIRFQTLSPQSKYIKNVKKNNMYTPIKTKFTGI